MSKTYKGYELIKEIAEGNIEDGTRFIIKGGEFNDFYATYEDKEIIVSMFGKELKLTTRYLIDNCTFEILEDEIDIQDIEEFSTLYAMSGVEFEIQDKLNELIRAIKQLDKKIKEK